jgi:cytochrome c peroxidase
MATKSFLFTLLILFFLTACDTSIKFTSEEDLGKALFHDVNLSKDRTQSCATCHNPQHGFVDTRNNEALALGVSLGDDNFSIGVRNTPTASYARFSPNFSALHANAPTDDNGFIGGQFLDGRETDLKGQAGGPPLNPVEMNMPDKDAVVDRIKKDHNYIDAFIAFYGRNIFTDTDQAYLKMTEAVAKFEKTPEFAPFDSKWDRHLKGEYTLTFPELTGKAVFFAAQNSSCVNCHMIGDPPNGTDIQNPRQTFTNYKYFNLGVPENTDLINAIVSKGLHAGFLANGDMGLFENPQVTDENLKGKFRTPTLRNIAITGPYMHNGVFKELKTVLEFYDFRSNVTGDRRPNNPETGIPWKATPFPNTVDHGKLGMQKLTNANIDGLECFFRLLTDKKYEDKLPPLRPGLDCS